jgi:hypothetical protein
MIRTTLETILCLVLSPVLVAQQISSTAVRAESDSQPDAIETSVPISTLPPGTRIVLLMAAFRPRLLAVDSSLELVVLHDVKMNGTTVLRAGTTIPAILTDERHGSFAVRQDETIRIHAPELRSGLPLRIRIPRETYRNSLKDRGDFSWTYVIFALVLIILPIAILRGGDN